RLQPQLRLMVLVSFIAAFLPLYSLGFDPGIFSWAGGDVAFAILWAIGIACAVGAAYQAKFHRLVALIMLGGAGFVTCITFVWLSAPDLALTQLLVEVVTAILILLGLRWLPKRSLMETPGKVTIGARLRRYRDLVLAVGAGSGMTLIAYAVMTRAPPATISDYFLEKA